MRLQNLKIQNETGMTLLKVQFEVLGGQHQGRHDCNKSNYVYNSV